MAGGLSAGLKEERPSAGPREMHRLAPGSAPGRYDRITLTPVGVTLGAVVSGVDLRDTCDDEVFAELRAALAEWKVLFFRDQHLTKQQHADFATKWGDVVDDQMVVKMAPNPVDNLVEFARDAKTPGLENGWHSDGTFRPMPTMGTILRAIEVPPLGGDTMFVDMAAVYDNLPPAIKERIAGRTAIHDWSLGAYATKYGERLAELRATTPPVEHPVVIRHPETGRATLFVNRLFTKEIVGLDPDDSDELLDLLCRYLDLPEFHCRFHWEPGSIAFWDNVACQHYGLNDYFPQRRVMVRATFFSREHTHLAGLTAPSGDDGGRRGSDGPGAPPSLWRAGDRGSALCR